MKDMKQCRWKTWSSNESFDTVTEGTTETDTDCMFKAVTLDVNGRIEVVTLIWVDAAAKGASYSDTDERLKAAALDVNRRLEVVTLVSFKAAGTKGTTETGDTDKRLESLTLYVGGSLESGKFKAEAHWMLMEDFWSDHTIMITPPGSKVQSKTASWHHQQL